MAACPCEVVAPCSETCGCAFPDRSTACRRCATFGSDVERILRADLLATLVDHGEKAGLAIQRDRRGPTFLNFVVAFERRMASEPPTANRVTALFEFLETFRPDLVTRFRNIPQLSHWRHRDGRLAANYVPEFWTWLGDNWAPPAEVPS